MEHKYQVIFKEYNGNFNFEIKKCNVKQQKENEN